MSNNRLFLLPMGVDNMNDYYTKEEINQLLSEQSGFTVVAELPSTGDPTKIYLLGPTGSGSDQYEEYIYTDDTWVKIGDTSMDLSGYVTDLELGTALADKQDVLTAGTGIEIGTDNVISATVNTEEIEQAVAAAINDTRDSINQDLHNNYVRTQTMNDALKPYTPKAALDGYYTKNQMDTTIGSVYAEIEEKERVTSFALNDLEESKQDVLTAGAGITIGTDGTISANIPTLATVATTGDYADLTGTPTISTVGITGNYSDLNGAPTLATVATSGSYNDLTDKPTISTVNDATITIQQDGVTVGTFTVNEANDKTIVLTGGGGGGTNEWYGTQAQFDALGTYDADTDYYIIDQIKYSEIQGTPDLSSYATKTEMQTADAALTNAVAGKENQIVFLGTGGIATIGTPLEGITYAVEGETLPLTFVLDGIGTVTYNFVID